MNKKNDYKDVQSIVRPNIRETVAYHVEQVPCPVVLDANESPYSLSEKFGERLYEIIASTELNRYPDINGTALREVVANKEAAEPNEILFGNGSDEIIQTIISTFCNPGDSVLMPTPTFVMYSSIAKILSADCVEVPLQEDWTLNMDSFLDNISKSNPKVVFIASPNNPTGKQYSIEQIEHIANNCNGIVVIDEAYVDYAPFSVDKIYRSLPNIIVLKTLSKVGLAAIRLGYMLGDINLVEHINKVRLPYNINSVTQSVAIEAIKSWDEIMSQVTLVINERDRAYKILKTVEKVDPVPSSANFILMKIKSDISGTYKGLLDNGIRVRWFKNMPKLGDFFRVTIGKPADKDRFLWALRESV